MSRPKFYGLKACEREISAPPTLQWAMTPFLRCIWPLTDSTELPLGLASRVLTTPSLDLSALMLFLFLFRLLLVVVMLDLRGRCQRQSLADFYLSMSLSSHLLARRVAYTRIYTHTSFPPCIQSIPHIAKAVGDLSWRNKIFRIVSPQFGVRLLCPISSITSAIYFQ